MRTGLDFDEKRFASHMPSQAGQRLLLAVAAADGYIVESWDVLGAYMSVPNDQRFRVTMRRPPRADGTFKKPGIICVFRRAMQGDPATGAQ